MDIWSKILRLFNPVNRWKLGWQDALSKVLQEAQSNIDASMIVVVAKESDLYSEVLFLLCFAGLSLGTFVGFVVEHQVTQPSDMMFFPLAGFALGALAFNFRGYFLRRVAPKAVRERVAFRAKSVFFDHTQNREGPMILLYLSELEREVLFLTSPEILQQVSDHSVQRTLSTLAQRYDCKNPLASLEPAIRDLGQQLNITLGKNSTKANPMSVFIGPTDMKTNPMPVRILKGSKDIN